MATAVSPFRLAVLGLALLHLLSTAAADDNLVVRGHAVVATTEPRASVLLPNDADRAATSASTIAPRRLDVPAVAREEEDDDTTAPATTASATPPPTRSSCRCVCVSVHLREIAVDDTVPAPSGVTTTAATTTTNKKALLHALPLLAAPFLPPPLAALVVLSSLAPSARAAADDTCLMVAHATCTVYRYLPNADGTGRVDHSRPLDIVRPVTCGARHGRVSYPFLRHCHVRTLEFFNTPQGRVAFRVLADHPRLADPDAVVATGGDVCYVELAHMNYREGYYIRCPVRNCQRFPFVCCSYRPLYAVVREHMGTVAWDQYSNRTAIRAQA